MSIIKSRYGIIKRERVGTDSSEVVVQVAKRSVFKGDTNIL